MYPWEVKLSKKADKARTNLPDLQRDFFDTLVRDLERFGPVQGGWPNYSKLGKDLRHCHLSPKWVACWEVKDKKIRLLEVYYVGSRKDAPY